MRAHLVQMDIRWEDKTANFEAALTLLDRAEVSPGDLVVLPEMFDTGFSMNTKATADKDGRTLVFLTELATDLGVYVQGGRTVQACHCNQALNAMAIISPAGTLIDEYHKIHPFSLGREHESFVGGTRVITWPWGEGDKALTVCPAICYDLRFPELFRIGLTQGAQAYVLGASWPESRQTHWRALLIARAIENQAFVLGVNRTGSDPTLKYAGGSIAVGPQGEVLGELDARQAVLSVDINPREVRSWREKFPAWKDRRIQIANGQIANNK